MSTKLLILTNNPNRASFRQRIEVYLDILKSHNITPVVKLLPGSFIKRIKLLKSTRNYDVVLLHKKGLNPIDAFFLKKYARRIIYNYDDAVMFKDTHPGKYSRSHYVPFLRSTKIADSIIVGSEYLANFARKYNPDVNVLPLGLQFEEYYKPVQKDETLIRLVWIGSSSTLSYLESLKNTLERIGQKHSSVVLRIIGDNFFDLENMPVEKIKWRKDKRGDYLSECDIGLAPLPDNQFTRGKCSFKVLEYASAKLPVVASPVGTNSEYIKDGRTGFLAENENQWFEKISELIESKQMRLELGSKGYEHARNFDTKVIGKRLVKIISQKS